VLKSANQLPRISGARLPQERARDIEFAKRLKRLMEERELETRLSRIQLKIEAVEGRQDSLRQQIDAIVTRLERLEKK
jgi:hypothetical protein